MSTIPSDNHLERELIIHLIPGVLATSHFGKKKLANSSSHTFVLKHESHLQFHANVDADSPVVKFHFCHGIELWY